MISNCTLWMGEIEPWMNESFIKASFNQYGFKPKSVRLITDKRANKYHNFGFITFANLEEANNALFKLNSKKIPNTNMYFKLNLTKNNSKNNKNVYVGNLPRKINDIELFKFFKSKYPSVYYASIIADNGISRGYGFVHFFDEKEYQKCLNEMDGKLFYNRIINVKEKKNIEEMTNVKNNNNINILFNCFNINSFYNFNFMPFCPKNEKKEDFSSIENDETTISSQEKEKDLLSSNNLFNNEKNNFTENIDLLESDDNKTLYSKIQESVDKMFNYYKNRNDISKISKIACYYSSNQK